MCLHQGLAPGLHMLKNTLTGKLTKYSPICYTQSASLTVLVVRQQYKYICAGW